MKCICLLTISLLIATALVAQVDTGTISGVVRDESGAVIPQAKVTIRSTATGQVQSLTTDSRGLYVSLPLYAGDYDIEVSLPGFAKSIKRVELSVAQRIAADFSLTVGSTTQVVNVKASGASLQTETSTLSNLRTEAAVENLPLNGRSFAELMTLTAGVMPAQSQVTGSPAITAKRGPTAVSVSGLRFAENQFLVDGIYDNDNHNGQEILIFPPLDAVEEYREETSVADARFGRGGGGTVNLIYKSGTKDFHGDVFEYLRNSALDARNFFDSQIPEFRMNQFGGTLGGPLTPGKTPKTFFFVDYEGTRTRQGQTFISTVPTAAERLGNFSAFSQTIYNPLTQTEVAGVYHRQPFAGNIITSIDPVGQNLINFYTAYSDEVGQ